MSKELIEHYSRLWNVGEKETISRLKMASLLNMTPEAYMDFDNKINKRIEAKTQPKPQIPLISNAPFNTAHTIFTTYKTLGEVKSNDALRYIQDTLKKDLTGGNFVGRQSQLVSIGALELTAQNHYRVTPSFMNKSWDEVYSLWYYFTTQEAEKSKHNKAPRMVLNKLLDDDNRLTLEQKDQAVETLSRLLKQGFRTPDKTSILIEIEKLLTTLK